MDKIKLLAELYKSLILAFLTALFAMFAYFVINVYTLTNAQFLALVIGIIVACVAIVSFLILFKKEVNKLGEK